MNFCKTTLLLIVFASILSCKSTARSPQDVKTDMTQPVFDNLNDQEWIKEANESGSYVLVRQVVDDPQNPGARVSFYVLDSNSNEKMFESSINGGYVKWFDDTRIEFFSPPGMMPSTMSKDDFVTIYDVEKETSVKKSELKN